MRALILIFAATVAIAAAADNDKKIVCYWGSWSVYREGDGAFDLSYMDPKLCTHMIYTFVGLLPTGEVKILDPWCDLSTGGGKDNYNRFNKLRKQNPALKTMIAIGGWNEGSATYSNVVANPKLRRKMVDSVVAFVKKYNFDGFDVDWEYPAQRGGSPADKKNYVSLLKELRQRFDKEGFLLSAAVGAAEGSASQSYNIREISKYLHFINLMTYDLHGSWDGQTGMHAALYGDANDKLNVDAVIKYWLSQGAPAEKLILGVPFYGKSFTLSNQKSNGLGAPATDGAPGPYTKQPGMLGYNEICTNIKNQNWQVKYDENKKSVYAHKGNQWVSYDDEKTLKYKTDYIKKYNLGGAMVWSIETDDFRGKCGKKLPLLNALYRELGSGDSSTPSLPSGPEGEATNETAPPTSEEDNEESFNEVNYPQEPENPETPQQPPQQPSNSGQICQAEGYVRDPQDCSKFYYCQSYNNALIERPFNCPANLHYDISRGICDWPAAVQC